MHACERVSVWGSECVGQEVCGAVSVCKCVSVCII